MPARLLTIEVYESEILDPVDLAPLAAQLDALNGPAALLLVERDPEACHRSLIAARLASEYGVQAGHLRPPD